MKSFKEFLNEEEHEEYYHVTPTKNVKSILKHGIKPSIGKSASAAGETKKKTYLFKSHTDAEDATSNWLGDEHGENTKLSLLKVRVPKHKVETTSGAGWEHSTEHHIEPHHVHVVSKDF